MVCTSICLVVWVVALRKESVDRNREVFGIPYSAAMSLSARRAWIEIYNLSDIDDKFGVALRKESVDRNHNSIRRLLMSVVSLSARRAWIEISYGALAGATEISRSPQGERG